MNDHVSFIVTFNSESFREPVEDYLPENGVTLLFSPKSLCCVKLFHHKEGAWVQVLTCIHVITSLSYI